MKPTLRIESFTARDKSELVLFQHDRDFSITVNHAELMNTREHESELELARLGCARVATQRDPVVMVGGMGLGYTLRQALDMLPPHATVVLAELRPEIIKWNRKYLAELTGHPLKDKRVVIKIGDAAQLMRKSPGTFDAILLDLDNGPDGMTDPRNDRLYSYDGIRICMNALHAKGCLAIWSASIDTAFERRLEKQRLHVHRYRVPSHKGGKARSRCIWVVSRDRRSLPEPQQKRVRPPADAAGKQRKDAGEEQGPETKAEPTPPTPET